MKQSNPTTHWSQLTLEEQILFWHGVDAGRVVSALVPDKNKATRRRRGTHSTRPKCEKPEWFRPARYKKLGGQLGYAYNRLVMKDPVTGQPRLRIRMSLHPYYITHRELADRTNHFKPEKCSLLDTSWLLWISFCDAGKRTVGMCVSRLAYEVSPKDARGKVIPETVVTVSRMSRLIDEQVRYGVLAVSNEKKWDRESGEWFPKYVWLTDVAFKMLGVDMEKLAKEQEKALRKSEERRQLIAEGIISPDEDISAHAARKRWADKKKAEALRFRREKGAMRKRANRLAKLPQDIQLFEMMKHIRKTMPAGESMFCDDVRLEQLAIRQLYQMEIFTAQEAPD